MAENTIDNLSIQVTASAENAARVFDRLASSAGRLRGAASGAAGGMQDMAQGARDAVTATHEAGEQSGRAAERVRTSAARLSRAMYDADSAGRFAQTKSSLDVLNMKYDAAREHLAGLLNAETPNNRAIANATAEVQRLQTELENAGKSAEKGSKGIVFFWNQLKRVALYRVIRSVIREITDAFKTGITNLYHWSDLVNGHFAASMDRLATSSQYLKNSLGAMVSPLIETLVPILDVIIDKVVDVLNFFNMLVSAVSGSDTYTVAKKAAAVWDDSANKTKKAAKSAADDIKRTILGFDEINKLVKPNSSSGGSGSSSGKKQPNYGAMFEEKPLTGILKDISNWTSGLPDWLKALLGVGAFALPIFGIPALLKTIWNWLKKLFSINIPDWFRWLFGPKDNGNGNGIDLPDNIKLPDADVKVNLDTDDIEEVKVPVSTTQTGDELFKDLRHDWNKNKTTLFMNDKLLDDGGELFKNLRTEWNKGKTTLFADVRLLKTGGELFKRLRKDWNKVKTTLMIDVKLLKTGSELFKKLREDWNKVKTTLFVPDKLLYSGEELFKEFRTSWNRAKTTMFVDVKLLKTGEELFKELRTSWNTTKTTLFVAVSLIKSGWTTVEKYIDDNFGGANGGGGNTRGGGAGRKYTVNIGLNSPSQGETLSLWDRIKNAWEASVIAADKTLDVFVRPVAQKTRSILGSAFGKLRDWLFPGAKAEEMQVDVFVNSQPGTGMSRKSAYGYGSQSLTPNVNDTSVIATVSAKAGNNMWFSWYNGLNPTVNDTSASASVNAYAGENMFGGSWWGGLTPNVEDTSSSVWVDADTPWWYWGKSLLSWIGADNLQTTLWIDAAVSNVQQVVSNVKNTVANVSSAITSAFSKAKGGIYSNGAWSDIPQYSGGKYGVNHGSLFWAGENGAEIVGNAGGRTEVLNKSQIASAMFSAVQAAMAPAAANFASAAESMGSVSIGFDIETLAEMVRQGVEQAMSRSNDYDRQKVDLLRQINDKDFTAEVTSDSINNAQRRMNRRAGTTVVAVG